jgi:preprotein translocase subunit SecE
MSKSPQLADVPSSVATPKFNRGIRGFFAEVGREMRKVNWPPRSETTRLTGIVLAVCGMVVIFMVVLNYVFGYVMALLMNSKGL